MDTDPTLVSDLDALLEPITAGEPDDSPLRWTSKSVSKLTAELQALGHPVGHRVDELLHNTRSVPISIPHGIRRNKCRIGVQALVQRPPTTSRNAKYANWGTLHEIGKTHGAGGRELMKGTHQLKACPLTFVSSYRRWP